ncbi:MAG: nitroreductase family protein [Anaerovoracaceae bacterium]|jgi:nitroreductase
MNETLRTIAQRYSCRSFSDEMPSEEQVNAIVEAGLQAPSAMNRQPWRIIVVKDRNLIREMDEEGMKELSLMGDKSGYERIMERGGRMYYNAPVMLVIPVEKNMGYELIDCGILAENIALAATSLGLGSVICGLAAKTFSGEKGPEFKKKIKFPDGFELGITVLIGYPARGIQPTPHTPDGTKVIMINGDDYK